MKQYFSADVGAVGVSGLWQEAGQAPTAEGKVTGVTRPVTPKSLNMETGAQPSVLQVTWVLTLGKLLFYTDSICKYWLLHLWFYICSVVMLQLQWGAAAKV